MEHVAQMNEKPYLFSKDDPERAAAMGRLGSPRMKKHWQKKKELLRNISLVLQAKMDVSPDMERTLKKMGIRAMKKQVACGVFATARIMQRVMSTGDYKGFESLLRITGHTFDQLTAKDNATQERTPDPRPKFSPYEADELMRRMGIND